MRTLAALSMLASITGCRWKYNNNKIRGRDYCYTPENNNYMNATPRNRLVQHVQQSDTDRMLVCRHSLGTVHTVEELRTTKWPLCARVCACVCVCVCVCECECVCVCVCDSVRYTHVRVYYMLTHIQALTSEKIWKDRAAVSHKWQQPEKNSKLYKCVRVGEKDVG